VRGKTMDRRWRPYSVFHGNDSEIGHSTTARLPTIERIEGTRVRAKTDAECVLEFDTATFKEYALGYVQVPSNRRTGQKPRPTFMPLI